MQASISGIRTLRSFICLPARTCLQKRIVFTLIPDRLPSMQGKHPAETVNLDTNWLMEMSKKFKGREHKERKN